MWDQYRVKRSKGMGRGRVELTSSNTETSNLEVSWSFRVVQN